MEAMTFHTVDHNVALCSFTFNDTIKEGDSLSKMGAGNCLAQLRIEVSDSAFPDSIDAYIGVWATDNPAEFEITCGEERLHSIDETFTVEGKFNEEELKAKIIKVIEESWDCRLVCRPD